MNDRKSNFLLIYILLSMAYFFSYFFRISTTVVLPMLRNSLHMGSDIAGFISSMYFYTYALMQPLCGILNDKFGPSRTVGAGIIITSVGSICFGLGNNIGYLVIGRLLMGIGLSPMLSGILVFQSNIFSGEKYALMSGISMAIGNLGSVVSIAPLSIALVKFGREKVFILLAIITIAISLVLIINTEKYPITNRSELNKELKMRFSIALNVMKHNSQIKIIIISWSIYFGALMAYQGLWALSWFNVVYPNSPSLSKTGATLIGVGVMVGNLLGGRIKTKKENRHIILKKFSLILFFTWILLIAAFAIRTNILITIFISILLGIVSGMIFVQLTAAVNEIGPDGQEGAVFGLVNGCTFISVMIFQWASGIIINEANLYYNEEQSYLICFLVVLIALVVPITTNHFIKPLKKHSIR